jgi:ribonucleotide reductase beta subunit family protein with ferritin-like domain
MKWFDAVIAGKQHTDFFASRVTNYSKRSYGLVSSILNNKL